MTEEELQQKTAALAQREAQFNADRLRFELQHALHNLKVRPEALADAAALMASVYVAEFGDDGRVSALKAGETIYETVADAASAFLSERAYFAQPASSAKSAEAEPKPVHPQEAIREGFSARPRNHSSEVIATKLPKGTVTELLDQGYSSSSLISEGWANPPK